MGHARIATLEYHFFLIWFYLSSTVHHMLICQCIRHHNEHRNKSIVATTPSYLLCNCSNFDVQYLIQSFLPERTCHFSLSALDRGYGIWQPSLFATPFNPSIYSQPTILSGSLDAFHRLRTIAKLFLDFPDLISSFLKLTFRSVTGDAIRQR